VPVMTTRRPDVLRLRSPADLITAIPQLLGFVPTDSVVAVCLRGADARVGLTMRFDLPAAADAEPFAQMVDARVQLDNADGVFVVVFSAQPPTDGHLPHGRIATALVDTLGERLGSIVLTASGRWWPFGCDNDGCGDPLGNPIEPAAPGAMAVAAAYALAGHGVLPNRAAVATSVALELDASAQVVMRRRIRSYRRRYARVSQEARRAVVSVLVERLVARLADPRGELSTDDAAELAALCDDVVVRDQVLIRSIDEPSRAALLPVLRALVKQVPSPFDAPACAMLAWVSYADGDGVVANVMVERSLATDPLYSLAGLISDALYRQVPPRALEEVMREAARDLGHHGAAG
jgi:hypothetical protein